MKFAGLDACGPDAWDRLVCASPDGWVWALAGWQRLILGVPEWQLEDHSLALFDGDRLVGVMPLQYQAAGRRMASSGWGVSGPVASGALSPDEREQVLGALLTEAERIARTCGAARLELGISPLIPTSLTAPWGVNPFVRFGYRDLSTTTCILDLSAGEERIWAGVSQNAKRKIKLARSRGIAARRVDWVAMVDQYYEAHRDTYVRTGVTPHPRRYFEGIARELSAGGYAVLHAAFAGDRPIAFRNDARFGAGALYHTGCSRDEALENGANYLLVWESIQAAIRDGFRWYEIGEVFLDARDGKAFGLTEFKSRFGGELHRYFKGVREIAPPEAADPAPALTPAAETAPAALRRTWRRTIREWLSPAGGRQP